MPAGSGWPTCRALSTARVANALLMEQERRALNQLLHPRIQASAPLAAAFATSLPGCGPILAAMPLAELDALDRGKIASLAAKSKPFGERCRQLTAKGRRRRPLSRR